MIQTTNQPVYNTCRAVVLPVTCWSPAGPAGATRCQILWSSSGGRCAVRRRTSHGSKDAEKARKGAVLLAVPAWNPNLKTQHI